MMMTDDVERVDEVRVIKEERGEEVFVAVKKRNK